MLNQPYPYLHITKNNSVINIFISIAVFLINYLINDKHVVIKYFYVDHLTFSIIFGLITGFFIFLVLEIIPRLFFKDEWVENWRVWNELVLIIMLFLLIIIGNYIFLLLSARDFHQVFQVKTFLMVAIQGVVIGILPAFIAVLISYTLFLKKNLKEIAIYNEQLLKRLPPEEFLETEREIYISSSIKSENICLYPSQLWFVKSEGNYVEIYSKKQQSLEKEVYRTSIKNIEEAFQEFPMIMRTHRCYIVNLEKVKKCKGNARNFQLYFDDSEIMVPVSRARFSEIKSYMNAI